MTEHHLRLLSLKGGCKGSSESTFVKMPFLLVSHVTAHFCLDPHVRTNTVGYRDFQIQKQMTKQTNIVANGTAWVK